MSLSELFAERSIICAHIVDDAFDEVPTYALTAEDSQHFLEVANDEELKIISDILELPEVNEDDIRDRLQIVEDIHKVFAHREKFSESTERVLFGPFDKDKEGKHSQLKPLIDLLEKNGVKCLCFGSNYDPEGKDVPQLFFVDLKLNEGASEIRHDDAVKVYKKLKAIHSNCQPFIFLMSSLTPELGHKRELFRQDADLFQSEFEDISKDTFNNGDEFSRILASYTRAMPQLISLRSNMKEVEMAVVEATKNVMRELRALDLADYFVLYHNTISVEKAKLGSYIVEMLLEFLAHEVEGQNQVWNLAKALDTLKVQQLPRARFGLTQHAAKLYSANMLHSVQMLRAEDEMQDGPSEGYFFTGDIFFDAQFLKQKLPLPTKALVIITPACDLVRPEQLKEKSILLCEGSVRAMEKGSSLIATDALPLVVMQHPLVREQTIVIEWHKKKLHVWDDEERAKFKNPDECPFVRVGRLRPVYALQLQHAVTSDLSRVGTQKPPSALVPHILKCFVSDGQKWHEIYAAAEPNAAALSDAEAKGKRITTFVLADQAVHQALVKLSKWIESNPKVKDKASLEKIQVDEAREILRGYKQQVSNDKNPDVTAYPFSGVWTGNEAKIVALVRGTRCSSPYAQIQDGQSVNKDKQESRIVFRLEPYTLQEEDTQIESH